MLNVEEGLVHNSGLPDRRCKQCPHKPKMYEARVIKWMTLRCRLCSALSSSPSYSTHQVLGGDFLRLQNDNVLTHSSVVGGRCRFVPPDLPPFETLCGTADEELFRNITTNKQYVLHRFLPSASHASQNYNLRPRGHNRALPNRISHLTDCNFIKRMLYKNIHLQPAYVGLQ